MILVNFIPSSEVVRTRWWVYDLALAVGLLIGGFMLTAYMLGVNYSQVDAIYQRSKNLERDLGEKSQVLSLVGEKNRQLKALGLTSERIFAEDADKKTKGELTFVTHHLLKKLPADMWLTKLEASPKHSGLRSWQLTGRARSYGAISKFLGALANDATFRQALAANKLSLGALSLKRLDRDMAKTDEIRYGISLTIKDESSRYAKRQVRQSTDHRL